MRLFASAVQRCADMRAIRLARLRRPCSRSLCCPAALPQALQSILQQFAVPARPRSLRRYHHATDDTADTIYALSTAPGKAAIAVIRVSGPACRHIYSRLCPGAVFPRPRVAALRKLYAPRQQLEPDPEPERHSTALLDPGALLLSFPGPQSVTGEDVLELHVHGGRAVVAAVLAAVPKCRDRHSSATPAALRIRPADPGEFTRRAFANARVSLPQIEALADTLAAETEQQRRLAVHGSGSAAAELAARYEAWRTLLLHARAELEALIDFAEDQHFDERPDALCASVARQVLRLRALMHAHVANAVRGELVRAGIGVALLGAPNAGKSSLLNRVLGRDAAIVSRHAGTTRDVVEVAVDLGGWLVRIGDMAGLRRTAGSGAADTVEREGIRRAKERALQSDVVILVQDACAALDAEVVTAAKACMERGIAVVAAVNKMDTYASATKDDHAAKWTTRLRNVLGLPPERICFISCKPETDTPLNEAAPDTGNIQALMATMTTTFASMTAALAPLDPDFAQCRPSPPAGAQDAAPPDPDPSIWQDALGTTDRQRALLAECIGYLDSFLESVHGEPGHGLHTVDLEVGYGDEGESHVDIVVAAEALRMAAEALARITGRGEAGDVEEVLGVVFGRCVLFDSVFALPLPLSLLLLDDSCPSGSVRAISLTVIRRCAPVQSESLSFVRVLVTLARPCKPTLTRTFVPADSVSANKHYKFVAA